MKMVTGWSSPNTGASNSSGFSALPGGWRSRDGAFHDVGNYGYWWSSTEASTITPWFRTLKYNTSYVLRGNVNKELGFSVRCVRD